MVIACRLRWGWLGAGIGLRQKWVLQWVKGSAGLLLLLVAGYMSVFALNLYGYKEYAQEVSVATVSFRESGEQSFIATVPRTDGSAEDCRLKGDQWPLDEQIIQRKMPFRLHGVKPGSQLEHRQGRNNELRDRTSRARQGHQQTLEPSAQGERA